MDKIVIRGGNRLKGTVPVSGAKNAALPLMATALLTDETLTLRNVPDLADIGTMNALLETLGVSSEIETAGNGERSYRLTARRISDTTAPYDLVRKMRASVLVLGPLLARVGEARVSLPGGCAIGTRPVDLHLRAMEALGAVVKLEEGYIIATAPQGLKGGRVVFPMPSVGATENLLMAASLAVGETTVLNAAREPEIVDLAVCLNRMGAKIEGAGSDTITITGVSGLHGTDHKVIADRIEAGTYAMAALATGGDLLLKGARADDLGSVLDVIKRAGGTAKPHADGVQVQLTSNRPQGVDVMTEPFPGFPTDLQAQIMAVMVGAEGASMITETIFENRFMHVPELCRMGANITVHQASALVRGVRTLKGAPVMATDLRASVSLVLAALQAEGETTLNRIYHLDRGYENLVQKLSACGADLERLPA